MKASFLVLGLMLMTMTAAGDFSAPLAVTSLLCTGTGVQDQRSVISLSLKPRPGTLHYRATYRIDQEEKVDFLMAPLTLQSEGSLLIQTYGKYAAGEQDYLNLFMFVPDANLPLDFSFKGSISFNRQKKFEVTCVGKILEDGIQDSSVTPPLARRAK